MAKLKHVTVADHERLYFIRWMLLLIIANDAAGLPEANRQRLHALLFVSFASSKFYEIKPLRQRARRTDHGPYYRMAHIALGHLVMAGFVDVTEFRPHPAPRDLQFEGIFRPTLAGLRAGEDLRKTLTGEKIYRLLLDICLASAEALGPEQIADEGMVLDQTLSEDLTYQRALRKHGEMLELEDPGDSQTPTVRGLMAIDERLKGRGFFNKRDTVAVYQTLMSKRALGARQ